MIVRVGSTRPAKVEGAREALVAIARIDPRFAAFTLEPHDLTHIAPRQPMSVAEILDGARSRAQALRHQRHERHVRHEDHEDHDDHEGHEDHEGPNGLHPHDVPRDARALAESALETVAVGVEGGLVEVMPGVWSLQSWAAVTDGQRWGYGAGPALVLPAGVVERVLGGEELGDVIDGLVGEQVRGTRGAWGVLTLDLIGRREAFRLAVIAAFAPFYNAAAWHG